MITDLEKKLVFKVAKGEVQNFPLIHSIRNISKDYIKILMYCVKKDLTGKNFSQFFLDHQGSTIRVISTFLKLIEQEKDRAVNIHDLR